MFRFLLDFFRGLHDFLCFKTDVKMIAVSKVCFLPQYIVKICNYDKIFEILILQKKRDFLIFLFWKTPDATKRNIKLQTKRTKNFSFKIKRRKEK